MNAPHAVRVLSSYVYDRDDGPHTSMGRRNRWFHGFVKSVVRGGSRLEDLDVQFDRLPDADTDVAALAARYASAGVRLVICAGTDSVVRWARADRNLATLYFGAHPENNGLEVLRRGRISGVRLNLPLIWSFENFKLLGRLLPQLEALYVPLNLRSEFAFPNVRTNYELFRSRHDGAWIEGPSSYVGHRSVQFLAERLGCRYYERPYVGLDDLKSSLEAVGGGTRSAVVGFNDTTLLDGAVDVVLEVTGAAGLPLFWVNNYPIIEAGGVADFSSDFERVGQALGRMALRILRDGVPPDEVPFEEDPGQRLGLNLGRCAELKLTVSEELKKCFQATCG